MQEAARLLLFRPRLTHDIERDAGIEFVSESKFIGRRFGQKLGEFVLTLVMTVSKPSKPTPQKIEDAERNNEQDDENAGTHNRQTSFYV